MSQNSVDNMHVLKPQPHATAEKATQDPISSESFSASNADDRQLLRLGKKPVLKRGFGFMSVLAFSCTVLITWEGAVITFSGALLNGGPAGVLWGFLINWIGMLSTFGTISELASLAPISGGQYHWVALLAPPSARNFLSFLTAWVTVLGWQAISISSAYLDATIIEGTIALTHPGFAPTRWQTVLVTWAALAFALIINVTSSHMLARFETVILILHLLGFVGILVPLVYFGPHGDASVFTTLHNGGGWSSNGLSFLVGLPTLVFSIFGADSAVHMSEEIQNASTNVPLAVILSLVVNGTLGFAMLVALMLRMGSLTAALDASDTVGYPYLEIFAQAVQSRGGAAAMSSILIVLGTCCIVGSVAATTRLLWAFARDRGLPFSSSLAKLNSRSALPVNAILTTITISVLISLISLGSAVALDDILSLSVAGLFSSYLICCSALLFRRLRGEVANHDDRFALTGVQSLRWGPWRIPEPFGTMNNVFACLYLTWIWFWTFWPPYAEVTPLTMNFNVVVFSAAVIFGIIWYFARARKYYHGPIVELT